MEFTTKIYFSLISLIFIFHVPAMGFDKSSINSENQQPKVSQIHEINGLVTDKAGNRISATKITIKAGTRVKSVLSALNGEFQLNWTGKNNLVHLIVSAEDYLTLDYRSVPLKSLTDSLIIFQLIRKSPNGKYDSSLYCIEGNVYDSEGKPIPYACARLEGILAVATADTNGHFEINNVPAGKYDISCTAIGYKKVIIANINVPEIVNSKLIFNLIVAPSIHGFRWSYPPPPFDKYSTSSSWSSDSAKLSRSPAKTINQALKACPGISR
jgi:hypothetical protein